MAKRKRISERERQEKLAKSVQQLQVERRRKRRQTLVRKSLALLRDCGTHVFLMIEESDGKCYKYNTKTVGFWPEPDVADSMNDPLLENDILNSRSYSDYEEDATAPTPASTPVQNEQPEQKVTFLTPPVLEASPVNQVPAFRFK